jgi:hypothetical protein
MTLQDPTNGDYLAAPPPPSSASSSFSCKRSISWFCEELLSQVGVKFSFVVVSMFVFCLFHHDHLFQVATTGSAIDIEDLDAVWTVFCNAIKSICNSLSKGLPWRFWLWFLVWTLAEYSFHRLCHTKAKYNPLWKMHRFHHSVPLAELTKKEHRWPKLLYFCFWFENFKETLEILLGETLPAVLIYVIDPECGLPLLVFHYAYEILATDSLLEHNPDIDQKEIVSTLAVGQFHLEHHRNPGVNFGFTITLWDHVFGTFKNPKATA